MGASSLVKSRCCIQRVKFFSCLRQARCRQEKQERCGRVDPRAASGRVSSGSVPENVSVDEVLGTVR